MTTPHTARCVIAAQAVCARIEAMIAANKECEHRGEALAYNEDAFAHCAHELELLAIEAINQ